MNVYKNYFHQIQKIFTPLSNVFGPRQDPHGAYAAVIPAWITALLKQQPAFIYGDGDKTRDFCYIDNVVQVNLLVATTENTQVFGKYFNNAGRNRLSLNEPYNGFLKLGGSHD